MGKCFSKKTPKEESKKKKYEEEKKELERPSTAPAGGELTFGADTFAQKQKGQLKQNYRITSKLGDGAFGSVRKAIHLQSNQVRAIKTIFKKQGSQKINSKEIIAEFEMLKSLDHPNIVKVYEFYEDAREYHIVTELCTGGDLFDHIEKNRKLTEQNAAFYLHQLLLALSYLHSKKVTHRDLKPENLLLTDQKQQSNLKLVDFGTAKLFDPDIELKEKFGTPYYMAPEVLKREYNHKCDIWSAGVILYILLSGQPPFNGPSDQAIEEAIRIGKVTFSKKWDSISKDAKNLITKMLDKNIQTRPEADECINHKWIQDRIKSNVQEPILESTLENLTKFSQTQKLQQAVSTFVTHSLTTSEEREDLQQVFKKLDKNNDGVLNREELLAGFYEKFTSQEEAEQFVDDIMAKCDTDGSGTLEFTEFITAAMDKRKLLSQERIEMAFKAFDEDGSGKISFQELNKMLGGKATKQIWTQMMGDVDENSDGEIDAKEFKEMLAKLF